MSVLSVYSIKLKRTKESGVKMYLLGRLMWRIDYIEDKQKLIIKYSDKKKKRKETK